MDEKYLPRMISGEFSKSKESDNTNVNEPSKQVISFFFSNHIVPRYYVNISFFSVTEIQIILL